MKNNRAGFCIRQPHVQVDEHLVSGAPSLLVQNHGHGSIIQDLANHNEIAPGVRNDSESSSANQFLADRLGDALLNTIRGGSIRKSRHRNGAVSAAAEIFIGEPVPAAGKNS